MTSPQLTRATVDVLELLLRAWQDNTDAYGWMIMKTLRRSGPAVYAVLDRLEDAGWITGTWEELPPDSPSRARRRLYRLTGQGVEAAQSNVPVSAPRPARFAPRPGRVVLPGTAG